MTKVYGCSDDIVVIEWNKDEYNVIDCFDKEVRLWFENGTTIKCGYGKQNLAIWYIDVESGSGNLIICNDENSEIYSDIFEIDSEVVKYKIIWGIKVYYNIFGHTDYDDYEKITGSYRLKEYEKENFYEMMKLAWEKEKQNGELLDYDYDVWYRNHWEKF